MLYTVYKIKNLTNSKIYIGVHKTSKLDDNYMGSSDILRNAIKKYGIENFEKEYIEIFDNSEDMFKMESQIVNKEFIRRKDTYNIKEGGYGGWDHTNYNVLTFEHRSKGGKKGVIKTNKIIKNKRENDPEYDKRFREICGNTFRGKKHTDETKRIIGEKNSKHQSGEGNSQYGTMWIYNFKRKLCKKIKKEEFPKYEIKGWLKGRRLKFLNK